MAKFTYKQSKETFINPYSFVEVDFAEPVERETIERAWEEENRLTGAISCSIYTKTPMVILDTATKEKKEYKDKFGNSKWHPVYHTLTTPDGTYMIPGASIRGMVRNVYETLTDSCFATIREEDALTMRGASAHPFSPALLIKEKDGWCLYKAERYSFVAKVNKKKPKPVQYKVFMDAARKERCIEVDGKKVYSGERVKLVPKTNSRVKKVETLHYMDAKSQGNDYLVLGEDFSQKFSESVFRKGEKATLKERVIDNKTLMEAMKGLEKSIAVYRNPAINRNLKQDGKWYASYDRMKKNGVIPVWYDEKSYNGKLYLSMAAVGRMSYHNTMSNLVGDKAPCTHRENMCPACRLFGMAKKNGNVGSRIRFSDALANDVSVLPLQPLEELGAPRTSYLPFYTEGGVDYDRNNVTIRGRKFYWHTGKDEWKEINKNVEKEIAADPGKAERTATVTPIETKDGKPFTFKIYFENISKKELQQLVYSLNFHENDKDGKLCYKIGHAKPLGFGSVKLVVDDVVTRSFSEEKGYQTESILAECLQEVPFKEDGNRTIQSLLAICDFDAVDGSKVRYPYISNPNHLQGGPNDLASHKWFGENKRRSNKTVEGEVQLLPTILGANGKQTEQTLYTYEIEEQ
ncbi:MAG: TIGR03986 family CRISPR-associated RAMP protein, partial [Firmicutes bacterium]|nr:TIGR03986 family CRISPR-associated RAMP protein [Bacillota bacterium]